MTDEPLVPTELNVDVTDDGVLHVKSDGYEAVYDALPRGETFGRIWRDKVYRGESPVEFAHIGLLTLTEAGTLSEATMTIAIQPYPRRVFVVARRQG